MNIILIIIIGFFTLIGMFVSLVIGIFLYGVIQDENDFAKQHGINRSDKEINKLLKQGKSR